MTEFVNENIRRLLTVCGDRTVQPKDSTASVCSGIRNDLDEVVRRKGRNIPEHSILKSQDIPLRTEAIVTCSQRRPTVHARRRPRNSGLRRSRTESPHIEIVPPFLKWRSRKEDFDQTDCVLPR